MAFTRRRFLQATGAATGAAALSPLLDLTSRGAAAAGADEGVAGAQWLMSGAITQASAQIVARITGTATQCTVLAATDPLFVNTVETDPVAVDADRYVKIDTAGLQPDTQYWYRLRVDGVDDLATTGKFRTAPSAPGATFTVALMNCTSTSLGGIAPSEATRGFWTAWGPESYATSNSAVTPGTGPRIFEVQPGLGFVVGMAVQATAAVGASAWLRGLVTDYTGTTLTLNVVTFKGTGSRSSWRLKVGPISAKANGWPLGTTNGEAQGGITGPHNTKTGSWPSASNSVAYDSIRQRGVAFALHAGDYGYSNVTTPDYATGLAYRQWFQDLGLSHARKRQFHAEVPFVWTWDDHDYGPDNTYADSPSGEAASAYYQQCTPHYPLVDTAGPSPELQASNPTPLRPGAAVYHTFDYGKVRFIVLDDRKYRTRPKDKYPGTTKGQPATQITMLGLAQRQWVLDQLSAFQADDSVGICMIVSGSTWQGPKGRGDTWDSFPNERRIIADHIAAHVTKQVVMVCGDSHEIGLDDGRPALDKTTGAVIKGGTNVTSNTPISHYNHPMVLIQAGTIGREYNNHNGPMYFNGSTDGTKSFVSQTSYSLITFTDNLDNTMTVTVECISVDARTGAESHVVHTPYTWTVSTA